jgi:prepilin-type N-terminal cleavage/methylation domain-containing protein
MKIFDDKTKRSRGMTYIEIIVVLSIFSIISSVTIFNYNDFQAKVDVKNLASDIALKIVEGQKSSLSGLLPPMTTVLGWKPSYGVYFDISNNKSFIYFIDLSSDGIFDGTDCTGECLNKTTITKENFIEKLNVYYLGNPTPTILNNLTITFSRPDSGAKLFSGAGAPLLNVSYVEITVKSPKGATSFIKLYPSGRIEVK